MKRIIALALLICLCLFCLTSCMSVNSIKNNIDKDQYKVKTLDEDEIDYYADMFDLDENDYNIKAAIVVTDRERGFYAIVFECSSFIKANSLYADLDENIDDIRDSFWIYGGSIQLEKKGSVVIIGHDDVLDDILDT